MTGWRDSVRIYSKPNILAQFFLGIPSGLPLALTAGTLSIWLKDAGLSLEAIGVFASVALPYTFKFIWAPLIDGFSVPFLGKRRGWMLVTHVAIMAAMLLMGMVDPAGAPGLLWAAAFFLAFASASHDIVKDAYRVEALPPEEQGAGSAAFVFGYRMAMLVSGAGALYLSDMVGWSFTYVTMAGVMLLLLPQLFFIREPVARAKTVATHTPGEWVREYVFMPFREFMSRERAVTILLFILLYRMTDGFMGVMAGPFYKELGFTNSEIAQVAKLYGLIATILGNILGGVLVFRLGVTKSLWIGGIASALSNLMFVWQAGQGHNLYALMVTISLDNISAAIATTAFVAYMSRLANLRFTATQYALLTSLAAAGRTLLATPSGAAAKALGWEGFFMVSTLIIIPALYVLSRLPKLTASEPPAASTLK